MRSFFQQLIISHKGLGRERAHLELARSAHVWISFDLPAHRERTRGGGVHTDANGHETSLGQLARARSSQGLLRRRDLQTTERRRGVGPRHRALNRPTRDSSRNDAPQARPRPSAICSTCRALQRGLGLQAALQLCTGSMAAGAGFELHGLLRADELIPPEFHLSSSVRIDAAYPVQVRRFRGNSVSLGALSDSPVTQSPQSVP